MKKGKLIVIDGSDGVGKATQTKLLVDRLKRERKPVMTVNFPMYATNHFGKLIRECLDGKRGDFVHTDPYVASVLYAADRFEAKVEIEKALAKGKTVIIDRYVSSNQMHQGGKIHDVKEQRKFLQWLDHMEHGVFKIPRPNLIIYLHLPVALSQQLIAGRGAIDTVEADTQYLENAQKSALKLVASKNDWRKVVCSSKDGILPREEIHEKVYALVKPLL